MKLLVSYVPQPGHYAQTVEMELDEKTTQHIWVAEVRNKLGFWPTKVQFIPWHQIVQILVKE